LTGDNVPVAPGVIEKAQADLKAVAAREARPVIAGADRRTRTG